MGGDNLEIVRSSFEAFNDRDWDGALEYAHPNVVWVNLPGLNLDAPDVVHGREGVRKFWEGFFSIWDTSFMRPVSFERIGDEVLAAVQFEAHGAGSGVPVELDYFGLYVLDDGLISRIENYSSREEALAAAEQRRRVVEPR